MIIQYLDASAIGGIETHVETLALAQLAAGEQVTVILHADYPHSKVRERYENAGLNVQVAGSLVGLIHLLRKNVPDILHTHGYKAGINGRLAARLLSIPLISTFHAGERGKGRMALYQKLDEWTSFVGGRLAVSRIIADYMPFKTKVMRNFVPLAPHPRKVPEKASFVFAGRLSHEKGPDIFCELASRNPMLGHFAVHGDGPMRQELETSFAGSATFYGFSNDMKRVLASASALVMTSRNEGLPMIALEAMALGVPVIAPAVGGLPELVSNGRNGFLFEAENLQSLESALRAFSSLTPQQMDKMGNLARETISGQFSPEIVLPDLFEAYQLAGWKSSRSIRTKVQSSMG